MSIHNFLISCFPLGIVIKIYEYDTTYKIFKNIDFNEELKNYKIIKNIRSYFDGLLEDGCIWENKYGIFTQFEENYNINIYYKYDVFIKNCDIYSLFAIIPYCLKYVKECDTLYQIPPELDFIQIKSYDGYVSLHENIENIPNDIKNKYNLAAYIYDRNLNIPNNRIIMYIK